MLLTPPPSTRKGLFGPRKRMTYYEDSYGRLNQDEDLEGPAQKCESESDSDSDNVALGGSLRPREGDRAISISSDSSGSSDVEYQIAPKFNAKRSLPAQEVKQLKLQTKRFGMFGSTGLKASGELPDVDQSGMADDEDTESPQAAPADHGRQKRRSATRRRPTTRKILKQQLAEKVLADKASARAKKLAERAAKAEQRAPKSPKTFKKELATESVVSQVVKSASKSSKKLGVPNAVVVIDNTAIDLKEYVRYP